jgi:hypothetical protein
MREAFRRVKGLHTSASLAIFTRHYNTETPEIYAVERVASPRDSAGSHAAGPKWPVGRLQTRHSRLGLGTLGLGLWSGLDFGAMSSEGRFWFPSPSVSEAPPLGVASAAAVAAKAADAIASVREASGDLSKSRSPQLAPARAGLIFGTFHLGAWRLGLLVDSGELDQSIDEAADCPQDKASRSRDEDPQQRSLV